MTVFQSLADYQRSREAFVWDRRENFNFGFDVVDHWAAQNPENEALFWVNDGEERRGTFRELSERSTQLAAALTAFFRFGAARA